jgi:hypothetical protein
MKNYLFLFSIFIFGCQQTKMENTTTETFPNEGVSHSSNQLQAQVKDDFSDLKKDDESCDTQEDLEKKIEEQARKKQAFQLQGGDEGCVVE